jgi:hypothetical protein
MCQGALSDALYLIGKEPRFIIYIFEIFISRPNEIIYLNEFYWLSF